LCFFAVELLLETWYLRQPNFEETLDYLTIGGIGSHGTYFFPVLLQLTIITPLIYYVVSKWKKGIFFCFAFNLAFEMCLLDDMEQDKSDWPPLLDDDSADDDEF